MKHTYDIGGTFIGYSGHFDDFVAGQIGQHPDVRSFPHLRSQTLLLITEYFLTRSHGLKKTARFASKARVMFKSNRMLHGDLREYLTKRLSMRVL